MKYNIINACSDLGVHVCGSENGPIKLSDKVKNNKNINNIYTVEKLEFNKSFDKNDRAKNLDEINRFNERLYNQVYDSVENGILPITLGGDHSVVISSALASLKKHNNLGIIWIDSHGDYNNFETTISGNIHGLPFAAVTGYEETDKLVKYHDGNFYNKFNAVLVGARDIDELEYENLKKADITIFTTEDIRKYGAYEIMQKAIKIASTNTNGIHISYDIDVIDPVIAPGVSIPAVDGINEEEAYEIMDAVIDNKSLVKSLDVVEYNPDLDVNDITLNIAYKLLNDFLNK